MLRTEAERVGLALPRKRRLDSALCFPSRHGLGIAWTRVEGHPPKAPGLGLVAPLLGQNGEVPQGEVAVDALVDATKLVGTLRCCSGITPERRGSLPMSLLPLRDCGFAGRNSVTSLFPSLSRKGQGLGVFSPCMERSTRRIPRFPGWTWNVRTSPRRRMRSSLVPSPGASTARIKVARLSPSLPS